MVNLVILLECFGICLTIIALLLLLNGDGAREQKLLIFIMCGSLVQNIGYLLELAAPTLEAAMTAVTVENVGSAFVPLCYCWFIYTYCYITPPAKLLKTLGTITLFILPTVFFNWNGLFYKDVQWVADANGFYHVSITYGPLYVFFLFTRIIIPFILCIHTLVSAIRVRSDQSVSRQYWTILVISSFPVIMLIAYICKLVKVFDLTPVTLGISMSMVVIVVWGRRNYDFRHLAAAKVLESLGDGVITLDDKNRLVSYNRAAAKNLLAIINDILDLSKVEAGKMELVYTDYYIKEMSNEIISMMDMAASQRGLILKYECDAAIPCRYNGDEGRIKQILINILNNAIKFTDIVLKTAKLGICGYILKPFESSDLLQRIRQAFEQQEQNNK